MENSKELIIKYAPRVALGLGVAVVSYGIAKKLGLFGKKEDEEIKEDKAKKAIKENPNVTLRPNDFVGMANAIYQAVKCQATDEEAVYSELRRLNTQDDWRVLQETYGTKKNDCPTYLPFPKRDLKSTLIDESKTYPFGRDNFTKKCKEILAENGIQF